MPKSNFPPSKAMGDVIRRERLGLGLHTQQELAEQLGNEIQRKQISFVESGKHGLSNRSARKLMDLFECDEFYLRGESPYKTRTERELAERDTDSEGKPVRLMLQLIKLGFGWKLIGTAGICFDDKDTDGEIIHLCSGAGEPLNVPDWCTSTTQYFIFETSDGEHAVSIPEFTKAAARIFSCMRTELEGLTGMVYVMPGWEGVLSSGVNGVADDKRLINCFEIYRQNGFDLARVAKIFGKRVEELFPPPDVNQQQGNEKKGEEQ